MVKSGLFKFVIFLLVTWTIINSITIIEEIYFLCAGEWREAFKFFYDVYCLDGLRALLRTHSSKTDLLIAFCVIVISGPLWLWWRKQTPIRAYILAMAGLFGNPLFIHSKLGLTDAPLTACMIFMVLFYVALIIFGMICQDYRQRLDLSKFLFWRRPWT